MEKLKEVSSSENMVIGGLSIVVLFYLIYPWLILVTIIGFSAGYASIHYFDNYSEKLERIFEKLTGIKVVKKRKFNVGQDAAGINEKTKLLDYDPLSSIETNNVIELNEKPMSSNRFGSGSNTTLAPAASPAFIPASYEMPKIDEINLKVDSRLDASISKFVTTVFDCYVSADWAPYLTRKQLKLTVKQLLTELGERINQHLMNNPDFILNFCKFKLIPLALDYVIKIQTHFGGVDSAELIFPEEKQQKVKLKIRKLCRTLLLECMTLEDDKKCEVWVELCVAVLADGVFWNVFVLGRDQIPELVFIHLKQQLELLKAGCDSQDKPDITITSEEGEGKEKIVPDFSDNFGKFGIDEVDEPKPSEKVPFLLDSFLDRKDSLEQPDPIVSRWRPTFKEIVIEADMLYPLIQYLKHVGGQRALAYLQAVLDDSTDTKEHCRRILEVEYLPGFCRSNFFHESMGLSRVEQGVDVTIDGSPSLLRGVNKGHSRTGSYGSKNNQGSFDLLRIEGGVVEGLPLYSDPGHGRPNSMSSGYGSSSTLAEMTETDSFFRRKPQVEEVIAKFLKSTISTPSSKPATTSFDNSSPKSTEISPNKHPRVGVNGKSYQDWSDPEVTKRVKVDGNKCDILWASADIVTSSISSQSWVEPVISGWISFLMPYLHPYFNDKLDEALKELLSLDLCIASIDLITEAFIKSGSDSLNNSESQNIPIYNSLKTVKTPTGSSSSSSSSSNGTTYKNSASISYSKFSISNQVLSSLLNIFISQIVNVDKFLSLLKVNRDYIFLLFVDVLDLLIVELFGNCCDTNNYGN